MAKTCQKLQMIGLSEPHKNQRGKDGKTVVHLRCGMWDCDYCADINRKKWRVFLFDRLPQVSKAWSMLTITCDSPQHASKTTLSYVVANFDKLMKRLKRLWGSFEYVRVYERHKSGEFHAHLLISYIPSDYPKKSVWRKLRGRVAYRGAAYYQLKTACVEVGFGEQVDISPVLEDGYDGYKVPANPAIVASYVTKYMSKDMANMPKGTRRIQTSSGIGALPKSDGLLRFTKRHFLLVDDVVGYTVYDNNYKRPITSDDFLQDATYPPMVKDDKGAITGGYDYDAMDKKQP
jgi:hypothetical protein